MSKINRRLFLLGGAGMASAIATPAWALARTTAAAAALPYPFQLGVASGDPRSDSVVLWTRLAPAPLNPDGFAGMPDATYTVDWELASDESFTAIVAQGSVATTRAIGHSVHVEPAGLQAGAGYFYRFKVDGHISPVGRTRTAPAAGTMPNQLKYCFASCQQWDMGWYHAHRGIAADNPDLVLFLGDYIYEKPSGAAVKVREVANTAEATTLANYRQRYSQYKTDPHLQASHAAAPWIAVFDDHEVMNNFNGSTPASTRKAAAFQAFYEHMPMRSTSKPVGSTIQLYRQFLWGDLARFHMLDTRQFRSTQATAGTTYCADIRSTSRTITGSTQEQWLLSAFDQTPTTWDFLGQQVFFAQRDADGVRGTGANCDNSADGWDGYQASRDRIAQGWVNRGVPNMVVLTGDVHQHYASDLRVDYYDHSAPLIGSELVTGGVTSMPGSAGHTASWFTNNPHVKYNNGFKRGYVRVTLSPAQLTADFRVVSDATIFDPAQVSITTDRTFAIAAGTHGLQPA